MRSLARHAVHVLAPFGVTLIGMLWDKHQPVTLALVIATLPAAAVATLRAIEARTTARRRSSSGAQKGPSVARPGT